MLKFNYKNKKFINPNANLGIIDALEFDISPLPSPTTEYKAIAKIIPKISGYLPINVILGRAQLGSERAYTNLQLRELDGKVITTVRTNEYDSLVVPLENAIAFKPYFVFFQNDSIDLTKTLYVPRQIIIKYAIKNNEYLDIKPIQEKR
jgi:hypothetical protein